MKKSINAVYFCLPAVIYISCSALAFLLWNLFNQGRTPVIATSIILCIAGSLLSGFFSIGKYGKRGMYAAIGITVAAVVLWIITYTLDFMPAAYVAAALSSYFFNILSCMPYSTPEYAIYIGYAAALIIPPCLILSGRFIRIKAHKWR